MIKTGDRNFWIAQLLGWGIFALVNFIIQFMTFKQGGELEEGLWLVFLNSSIAFTSGILVTTVYRYYIKRRSINLLNFGKTMGYIGLSTILLTVGFLIIINVLFMIFHEGRMLTGLEFLGNGFIFGILLLIWNSLYFMIHYIHSWKNAESEKWQLVASVKEAQLGNLKAQINPHFMFNAINNIRALISEDPVKAKEMLLNFSDMFRYSLVHNDQSMVSVKEELEIVNKYLELLSIQFEDKLTYEVFTDPLVMEKKIPPMMIQLLVENAVKHGISELPDGGKVDIKVLDEGEILVLKVSNTGGLGKSTTIQQKLGVGLQNIKERLGLIYGKQTLFNLSEHEGFVVAEIKIPLIMKSSAL